MTASTGRSHLNAGRGRPERPGRRSGRPARSIEALEARVLLASDTLNIDVAGLIQFSGSGDANKITISNDAGAGTFTFEDTADTILVTSVNPAVSVSGSGTGSVVVTYGAGAITGLDVDGGGGGDSISVESTSVTTSLTESGPLAPTPDAFNLGNATDGVQNLVGTVSVTDTHGGAALTVDDSADSKAQDGVLAVDTETENGSLSDLAPGLITFSGDQIGTMTVKGGSGGNNLTISGTVTGQTNLFAGIGSDIVTVLATQGPTDLDDQTGTDAVNLGGVGPSAMAGIAGAVNIASEGTIGVEMNDRGNTLDTSPTISLDSVNSLATFSGLSPGQISLESSVISVLTIDGGSATNDFTFDQTIPTTTRTPDVLNTGVGTNTINVQSAATGLSIVGTGGTDTVRLGAIGPTGTLAGFSGPISISNTKPSTTLNINDVADPTTKSVSAAGQGQGTTELIGLEASQISYTTSAVTSLGVDLGTGGDSVFLQFTPAPSTSFVSTGQDSYSVRGTTTGSTLNISSVGPGASNVAIGYQGLVSGIDGPVNLLEGAPGLLGLSIDDSADTMPVSATLGAIGSTAGFTGLAPSPISFVGSALSTIAVNEGPGVDALTVDLTRAPVIPTVNFNFGQNPAGSGLDTLQFQGGSNAESGYAPFGPGSGSVVIDQLKNFEFTNLNPAGGAPAAPIVDIAPSTAFTFTAPVVATSLSITDGAAIGGLQTASIASGSAMIVYPSLLFANSTNATFDTSNTTSGIAVAIHASTAPMGLKTIELDAGSTPDTVDLTASPAGVPLTIDEAAGNDSANVTLAGLGTSSPVSSIDGGTGTDALQVASSLGPATVLAPGSAGLPAGTPSGFGAIVAGGNAFAFGNFKSIGLSDPASAPSLFATSAITAAAGSPLDQVVATFRVSRSASAGDFSASIAWGDGTTSAGTVVAEASNPLAFQIVGMHTYSANGSNPVTVTLTDQGSTTMTTVGGVPVTTTVPASPPISLQTTTVNVTSEDLTSIGGISRGSSGQSATGFVASFTDTPISGLTYTTSINWGDGTSSTASVITTVSTTPTLITRAVSASHAYAAAGTYPIAVTITSSLGQSTVADGVAQVSATPLTVAGTTFEAVRGVSISGVVAGFNDPSTIAPNYTEIIHWGDGTTSAATSLKKVATTPTGGSSYLVSGTHIYSSVGTFPISVTIVSSAGSSATVASTADVAPGLARITPIAVSAGAGLPFSGPVGVLTDEGGAEPIASYSVFVVYNDGSDPVPATLSATTTPGTFLITAPHTFAFGGTFQGYVAAAAPEINTTLGAVNSSVLGFAITPIPITATAGAPLANVLVGSISCPSASSPGQLVASAPPAGYEAAVNWGDGSSPTFAAINPDGTIMGSHVYPTSGTYPVSVSMENTSLDDPGRSLVIESTNASVQPYVVPLTGAIVPSSLTGTPGAGNNTKVNTPAFSGTSQPGSTVILLGESLADTSNTLVLGQTIADPLGNWSLTSKILPDGSYYVGVEEADASGNPVSAQSIYSTTNGPLTIDTIGPRITGVDFNRSTGVVQVTYNDERSGIDQASVQDPANYEFIPIPSGKKSLPITSLTPRTVVTDPTSPETVVATIKAGVKLPAGKFVLTIVSGGAEDNAGNALDGEFYGYFPSGNGGAGGNFSSRLSARGAVVFNTNPLNKQQPVTLASVRASATGSHHPHAPKGPLHVQKVARHASKP